MNQIILTGRLVREVDLRISGGGIAIAKFTIAVDKGLYGDKKQEAINQGKQTADFYVKGFEDRFVYKQGDKVEVEIFEI
jgi:single-stranded DNA-binding protein